jgi:hypothetical protein
MLKAEYEATLGFKITTKVFNHIKKQIKQQLRTVKLNSKPLSKAL